MIPTFIPLLLTTADPVQVNLKHVMFYRLIAKDVTLVTLSNGAELFVEDSPEAIDAAIGGSEEIDRKLDEISLQIEELGAEFDRVMAELDADA